MSPFGFQQFSISDTGEVFVEAGDTQLSKGVLRDFPPMQLWPVLADCLAKSDFRPHVEGNRFVVAW